MKKGWLVILVLTIILALLAGLLLLKIISSPASEEAPSSRTKEKKEAANGISAQEKKMIDDWIVGNGLNPYGDPKDTVYIGGTPLFDESAGTSIDKYEYILRNYPDRPWVQ